VRASVAEEMSERYGYSQEEIAKKLGVVQVAVSKYLNRRYSKEISRMKKYIVERKLNLGVVKKIIGGKRRKQIDDAIDRLCDRLVAAQAA
jgi:predicted transcriptional regulator